MALLPSGESAGWFGSIVDGEVPDGEDSLGKGWSYSTVSIDSTKRERKALNLIQQRSYDIVRTSFKNADLDQCGGALQNKPTSPRKSRAEFSLPRSVTVAQEILVLFVLVQIQAG
jgi:hypothetical protein